MCLLLGETPVDVPLTILGFKLPLLNKIIDGKVFVFLVGFGKLRSTAAETVTAHDVDEPVCDVLAFGERLTQPQELLVNLDGGAQVDRFSTGSKQHAVSKGGENGVSGLMYHANDSYSKVFELGQTASHLHGA